MSPNDADGMANSVDPDQTAPRGAVWSGSALFAQAYLSENLGSLRYMYGASDIWLIKVPCVDLSIVPAVPWNCGAFNSMPQLAGLIPHIPAGI